MSKKTVNEDSFKNIPIEVMRLDGYYISISNSVFQKKIPERVELCLDFPRLVDAFAKIPSLLKGGKHV